MSRNHWSDEKLIFKAIHNKTETSYWENIHALRIRPSEALFQQCLQLISFGNQKEKRVGIDILAQLGLGHRPYLKETLALYFNLLENEQDELILNQVLFGIGHNNQNLNAEQIEKICAIYQKGSSLVYEGLIFALGFIDTPKTIEILIQLSTDKKPNNRDWATFYLGQSKRNNKKIREALWNRVRDRHYNTRLEAIMELAKRKDKSIINIIQTELIKGRSTAGLFDAIVDLKDTQFLPLLLKEQEKAKDYQQVSPYWQSCLDECIQNLLNTKNDEDHA